MTTPHRSDTGHCTTMTTAQLAALTGSAIRLARMKLGHFILETSAPPTLWQKQKVGGLLATLVNVSAGPLTAAQQVPYGNAAGTGLTAGAALTFDPAAKTLATTIFSAGAYLNLATLTGFYMRLTGTPTANRIFTIPNVADDTFALLGATQTLTSKTLTEPVIEVSDAINNHTSLAATVRHKTTAGVAAANMGTALAFYVRDVANLDTFLGGVQGKVVSDTVGAITSSMSLACVDGTGGPPITGLIVAPTGAVAARVRAIQLIPGATGANAQFLGIGEAAAGIDFRADAGGSLRLRNPADDATIFGVQATTVAGSGLSALTATAAVPAAVVTVNAPVGVVDFVNGTAWSTAVTVNNTSVEAGATVFAVLQGAFDATFTMVRVSAVIAGQFVLTGNAACTAPVKVAFLVVNPST